MNKLAFSVIVTTLGKNTGSEIWFEIGCELRSALLMRFIGREEHSFSDLS